ncbi:MAG: YidC/Oxa1 family membrane protein insertase [Oscillospiraceae bacterium]|nr:YidC/Oxa1 family membrane protein insertase [Oscillospiraceae bacterium]
MSFGSALYRLLIGPLELMFEVIFAIADRLVGNHGIAIIFLSLAINFLVLPLYRRADALQREQRDKAARMQAGVAHIKKTFQGNERFMMLQTFYRQHDYKQTDVFKGSISLLLQVPFFTAAYRFLSGLQLLRGTAFGPIRDMGAPDGLLTIFGVTLNLLPILMTAINYISASIYMKGFPLRSKLQTYGLALVFLVLLYNSPAGLVFYWTLNNLFSLLKNVFYKMKRPGLVLGAVFSAISVFGAVYFLFFYSVETLRMKLFLGLILAALQLPLILALFAGKRAALPPVRVGKQERLGFLLGCVLLTILTGLLIPSGVIGDSTSEFVDVIALHSPLNYLLSSVLIAAGTFLIWFEIFYHLADGRGKRVLGLAISILAVGAAVNYLFFGTGYGNLSEQLRFDVHPQSSYPQMFLNAGVLLALAGLIWLIWKKKQSMLRLFVGALCFAAFCMSLVNTFAIQKEYVEIRTQVEKSDEQLRIRLSKTGKNVVIIMLDRAVTCMVPYMMNECPDLVRAFDGFTYYPNAMSHGVCTNFGSPGLFGGYEYVPEEMNRRTDQLLQEKHDEALRLMPDLFYHAGYQVTVCDVPYAGYKTPSDYSIYDDYPGIHTYFAKNGSFNRPLSQEDTDFLRNRNFFCYSLFKAAPLVLQKTIYDRGNYNRADAAAMEDVQTTSQTMHTGTTASGYDRGFQNNYNVLKSLPDVTQIEASGNTFFMIDNELPHRPMLLQEPAYEPAPFVDDTEYEAAHNPRVAADGSQLYLSNEMQITHYHANMASFLMLAKWFDYLRKNDLYDNTRIILVSDHGWHLGFYPDLVKTAGNSESDMMILQCLMMVKDFDSKGFTVDQRFMTNADTPTLAMDGLIENPVNPFTGNPITDEMKYAGEQHATYSFDFSVAKNNGYAFIPCKWFSVHDDVRDPDNWEYIGYR